MSSGHWARTSWRPLTSTRRWKCWRKSALSNGTDSGARWKFHEYTLDSKPQEKHRGIILVPAVHRSPISCKLPYSFGRGRCRAREHRDWSPRVIKNSLSEMISRKNNRVERKPLQVWRMEFKWGWNWQVGREFPPARQLVFWGCTLFPAVDNLVSMFLVIPAQIQRRRSFGWRSWSRGSLGQEARTRSRNNRVSLELSHPVGQLEGSQVRRSCSGTTRQLSKPKLQGWRSSLAEDEIGLL